jgi:acyl-CoA synthetase (NDP forming)
VSRDLSRLLFPRSIAVIGASPRPGAVGGEILRNIMRCGYRGSVYPVNPKYTHVEGLPCLRDVEDLPRDTDLVIVAVNKRLVLDVVERCATRGQREFIIITAGFRETGPEGGEREAALTELVHRFEINLIGPNCMGLIYNSTDVRLNASFSRWFPKSGEIAFISQSGSLGETVLEFFEEAGLGVSLFANLGNRAGLSENDFLNYVAQDEKSQVIFLYLESFAAPAEFRRLVEEMGATKPVVVLKAGRTKAGAAAVASHTGSLASPDATVDAFLDQSGAIRVSSIPETLTVLSALERGAVPAGDRIAIVTNAGGAGIIAADACERSGLSVAPPALRVREKLASFLAEEAGLGNPIDMVATADSSQYERALCAVLPSYDAAIAIFRPPLVLNEPPEAVADAIVRATERFPRKPVLVCTLTRSPSLPSFAERLTCKKIPVYTMPEEAVGALAVLSKWTRRREELRPLTRAPHHRSREAERILELARRAGRSNLSFEEGALVLSIYGLEVAPFTYVEGVADARSFVKGVRFPVVAKIDAPGLLHRVEQGAVITGIANSHELQRAVDRLRDRIATGAALSGGRILLQPEVSGRELILGMKRDPSFGPVIVFGVGGTLVEALRDVSFGVAPLSPSQAERMIRSIRAFPLLEKFRGRPPVDLDSLASRLVNLGQLSLDLPAIGEIDLNPVIVGEQTAAVDIVMTLAKV